MKHDWKTLPFSDVISDETGGNIKTLQSEFLETGKYPIIDQGKDLIAGYTNSVDCLCKAKLPVIVFGDHTKCIKFIDSPFCLGADGVKVLRPKIDADEKYLFHYLQNVNIPNAGYSRHFKFLKRIEIPLPPLLEQRRIADILDKAEELRAKRREAIEKLESLKQAIFIDMFGDSSVIYSRWPVDKLGNSLDFLTSGSRGWAEYYSDNGDKFLRIQNVKNDELLLDDIAFVNAPNTAEARRTCVQTGDVLLSITADLGRTAVIPQNFGKAYINQHLSILRSTALNPRFLSGFLVSSAGKSQINSRNKHAVKAGLNFDDIRSILVPSPPSSLQKKYSEIMQKYDDHVAINRIGFKEVNCLFASLQEKAFGGEL